MTIASAIRKIWKVLLFGAAELVCSFVFIWYVYSTSAQIRDGYLAEHNAINWTLQMAIVTSLLASIAIVVSLYSSRSPRGLRSAFVDFFIVGIALTGYTALNFWWRNSWNGDFNKPAFLPLWNDVNSHFFYEWNWLSYLLFVSPAIALVSSAL